MPLLQHQALAALAGRPVDLERVGCWFGPGIRSSALTELPEVVARREHRPVAAEDHHPHGVVGLGAEERVVQLHEHAAVLRVPGVGPIQHDPGDRAVVERLVRHVLVLGRLGTGHAVPLDLARHVRPVDPES